MPSERFSFGKIGSAVALSVILLFALAKARGGSPGAENENYELVIANGRVMDPESGLDGVRSVGIRGGKIVAVSQKPLTGKATIDAKGLVVAPGFIDLHEHGQEPRNYQFQAHDGVTTSLELEVGTDDVDGWYAAREGNALINFGVSIGHIPVRIEVLHDPGPWLPTGDAAHRPATPEELAEMIAMMERGFRQGALAEGMGVNYTAAATHAEIVEMFRVAAKYQASVHVHLRYAGIKEPTTGLAALEEVVAAAAATGAPLHVVHITSMGLKYTPDLIAMVEGAQRHGLDVTTECYPYTAGSTALQSAVFDPGWQEAMGITYKDIQWTKTGERLTAETFDRYRKEGGIVVIHSRRGGANGGRESHRYDRQRRNDDHRREGTPPRPSDIFARARALRPRRKSSGPDDRSAEDDADARSTSGKPCTCIPDERPHSPWGRCRYHGLRRQPRHRQSHL